jgi:hypothetical protein
MSNDIQEAYYIKSNYSSDDDDSEERRRVASNIEKQNSVPILGNESPTLTGQLQIGSRMEEELHDNNNDSDSEDVKDQHSVLPIIYLQRSTIRRHVAAAFLCLITSGIVLGFNGSEVPRSLIYGDIKVCSVVLLVLHSLIMVGGLAVDLMIWKYSMAPGAIRTIVRVTSFYIRIFVLIYTVIASMTCFLFLMITYVPVLLQNHYEYLTNHSAFSSTGLLGNARIFTSVSGVAVLFQILVTFYNVLYTGCGPQALFNQKLTNIQKDELSCSVNDLKEED